MAIPLRLMIVEDSPDDAELLQRELRRSGYEVQANRVEDEEHFLAGLRGLPQIILMDYRLPEFSALRGLAILHERSLDIPCIVISGILSDETAVECIRQGAADYLLKDRLARLGAAVGRAIQEKEVRADKQRTEVALLESEEQFLRMTENAADIILRYRRGKNPRFLYINPSVRKITGFAQEEFYAAPQLWAERLSVDGQEAALAVEGDRTGIALMDLGPKLRFLRKDGTTAWLEQRVVTVRNGSDETDVVEGVIRDITENEQRDRELKAISSVASAMRSAPTRTDIYPILLQQLKDLLKADGVALAMKDSANDDMVVELAIGVWADRTGKRIGHAFANNGGITQPVRDARGMMNGLADVVCVPMISQGQTIGVLWAGCNAEINDEEVRILSGGGRYRRQCAAPGSPP